MKKFLLPMTGCALLLSACGSGSTATTGVRPGVSSAGMRPATNSHRGGAQAQRAAANPQPGEVIGRDRAALISQFGQPRLDAAEGAATRLQFSTTACVLDAYLYPPRAGATAVVTHVDARTPDGADMDRNACIAALRRR
jgi:hypothetical protein